jgi:tyrosinase
MLTRKSISSLLFQLLINPFRRISQSEIWDPETGFGGNGVPGTYTVPPDPTNTSRIHPSAFLGCVADGPFANYTLKLGPGLFVTDHCLTRGFNNTATQFLNTSAIEETLSQPTWEQFTVRLEGSPEIAPLHRAHDGGHVAVGGEMSNFFSSPGGKQLIYPLSRKTERHLLVF